MCSGFLATKCMSLNNEKCKTRLFVISLYHVKLNYYPLYNYFRSM